MRRSRMMRAGWATGLAMAAVLLAAPARAHPNSPELAARFANGAFLEAADLAEQAAGADDMAFAARALLAECMTADDGPDPDLVSRAARDAEAALKIDPRHDEARLQLAIALSLKTRSMDVMDAWKAGYGEKGKKLARDVLTADPDNYYAHGFLAVWNLEVRRRGGTVGAGIMGASLAEARRHYEEAARLAPDDIGVRWAYGRALAALDPRKYGDEAAEALAAAQAAPPSDRVGEVMRARAAALAEALKGDRKAAQKLAMKLL
jgi:hypothetical protein